MMEAQGFEDEEFPSIEKSPTPPKLPKVVELCKMYNVTFRKLESADINTIEPDNNIQRRFICYLDFLDECESQ